MEDNGIPKTAKEILTKELIRINTSIDRLNVKIDDANIIIQESTKSIEAYKGILDSLNNAISKL